jgi:hypothetical protein
VSNFAHTPFSHPEFGEFASVEGFWYWLSLGKVYEELRPLYGFKCKQKGKELKTNGAKETHVDDFEIQIKKALLLKVEQNQTVAKLLKESSLPLTHYYVYGNDLNDPGKYKIIHLNKFNWIVDYLSIVRLYLNGLAHKVIIAGSRDITDYTYLKSMFNKADLEVVEFVCFTLEEPPYFGTEFMGSHVYAKSLHDNNIDVIGMINYEMIGYFTNENVDLSKLSMFITKKQADISKGNFIAAVCDEQSKDFMNEPLANCNK